MRALAVGVVALLLLGAQAAAGPTEPLLGVTASGMGLVLLSETGDVADVVVPEGRRLVTIGAVWSPDGTRIAFSSPRDGVGREVYVVDADGTKLHAVTSGSDDQRYNTGPVWVSASEIAYYHIDSPGDRTEVRVVDVETGADRRLVPDAGGAYPLRPQPGGRLLIYQRRPPLARAFVDVDTGAQRPLPDDVGDVLAWEPDGSHIAYGNSAGLFVISSVGSDRKTLVPDRNVRSVDWSPDGRRLAVGIADIWAYTKVGPAVLSNLYVVDADGSDFRRLTGLVNDSPFQADPADLDPRWWPSGTGLFFTTTRPTGKAPQIWTMNADGSCEQPWATVTAIQGVPSWRPGAAGPSTGVLCTSVIARVRPAGTRVALRDQARILVQVANDGTQPLTNVRLRISSDRGVVERPVGCDPQVIRECELPTLARGAERAVSVPVWAPTPGPIRVRVQVDYPGAPDHFPGDDGGTALVDVLPCDLLGTYAADRLIGTPRADRICAGAGDDRIEGRGGNDQVDAGPGNDTVIGGAGRDRIFGRDGRDVVLARDGARDVVDCGAARDTAIVDGNDVLRNCETALRR
jgi:Tol biopolymer transport system component